MTQRSPWRLICSSPAPGAWNMAVDEAILKSVGQSQVAPTLRLYAWNPPCLSLGFAQPVQDVDLPALAGRGWHLVRRPTGGRAILHADELTYSVIAPLNEPRVYGSVLESYSRLAQALLKALEHIGLPARADKEYAHSAEVQPAGPVCFEVPSKYEITANGKKIIGSAQARRKDGVLQHGSLPLSGDLTRITQVLSYSDEETRSRAAERLLEHATTIETLGFSVTWETCAAAFQTAFAETLDLNLHEDSLTSAEKRRAAELVEQKYNHPSWTNRI